MDGFEIGVVAVVDVPLGVVVATLAENHHHGLEGARVPPVAPVPVTIAIAGPVPPVPAPAPEPGGGPVGPVDPVDDILAY